MRVPLRVKDVGQRPHEILSPVLPADLPPLPPPYDGPEAQPAWKPIKPAALESKIGRASCRERV